ncbi:hypothetical protein [Pontibacter cellulosilyticus]|uniref:Uncharacterized protein n=1 Tax=Pontibacter cellulosilyticus TaxID=1720253 RepID=A0A923NA12_9BACT|nr:hypothetical protein [Pontibacter cellulosilyticus]MBC5994954.1 hypothetical protein [Pontibacter cellulosilyticus]
MRKFYTLLFAVLVVTGSAFAQTEFSSFQVPFRSAEYLKSSVSADGEICLYAYSQNLIHLLHLDSNGQVKARASNTAPLGAMPQLLGDLPLRDKFVYFERRNGPNGEKIQPFYLNKADGRLLHAEEADLPLDPRSQLLQAFTSDSTFYALYYSKKTNTIQVFAFTSAVDYKIKKFNLNSILYMEDRLFKPTTSPVYIGTDLDNELYQAQFTKKLFLHQNKLYFLFDGFVGPGASHKNLTTEVLTLDLNTETSSLSALPTIEDTHKENISSYLFGNTLFRYIMTGKDIVQLEIYDVENLALKKSYKYTADEKVTLQATAVAKTGKLPDVSQAETARSMIQKMHTGSVAVVVNKAPDNTIELQLGTYDVKNNPAAMLPTGAGLLPAMGPGAIPIMAAMLIIKASAADAPPKEKNSYYKAYLNAETFEIVNDVSRTGTSDMVQLQTNRLVMEKVGIGAVVTYAYKGNVHYGYVDKKTRQLKILTLTPAEATPEATSSVN